MGEPVEVLEGSDSEINRLFPKCHPRLHAFAPTFSAINSTHGPPDVNRNCVSDANDNYASITSAPDDDVTSQPDEMSSGGSSRMSVDASSPTPASHCSSSPSSHNAYFPQTPSNRGCAPSIDNVNDDLSVVSAYLDDRFSSAVLDSSYEESPGSGGLRSPPSVNSHKPGIVPLPPPQNEVPQQLLRREHFRLRDSRIETAGGKEMFSQSRSRTARKRHEDGRKSHHTFAHHYNQPLIHQSHHHHHHHHATHLQKHIAAQQPPQQQQQQNQQQEHTSSVGGEYQGKDSRSSSTSRSNSSNSHLNSSSSSSSSDSSISRASKEGTDAEGLEDDAQQSPEKEGDVLGASTLVYETPLSGSSEVVFDDISEWVERGLTVRGVEGSSRISGGNRGSKVGEQQQKQTQHQQQQQQQHFIATPVTPPTPPSQTDSEYDDDEDDDEDEDSPTRVTRIGSVQIAEYEGSPRRYGQPQRPPRPGFPRRVSGGCAQDKSGKGDSKRKLRSGQVSDPKGLLAAPQRETERDSLVEESGDKVNQKGGEGDGNISISTLTSSYASSFAKNPTTKSTASTSVPPPDYEMQDDKAPEFYENFSFEESETRKVLQEFFLDSQGKPPNDFYDLEYTLKRQHGNSYVGQRLAAVECEEGAEPNIFEGAECNNENSDRQVEGNLTDLHVNSEEQCTLNVQIDNHSADQKIHKIPNLLQIHENGKCPQLKHGVGLQFENGSGPEQDKETGPKLENGRFLQQENETGPHLENSEMGISRNFTLSPETTSCDSLDVESEFSAGEGEGSIPSSGKIVSIMPVLEDGLSSGEESEMEATDESMVFCQEKSQDLLRHQLFLNPQNQRFYTPQHPSEVSYYEENKNGEVEDETEMERERTLQRARSLDNQLCRGELPLPSLSGGHTPGVYSHIQFAPLSVSSVSSYPATTSYSPIPFPDNSSHPHATSSPHGKVPHVIMFPDTEGRISTSTHSPTKTTLSLMKKQISEIEREIALKKPEAGQAGMRKPHSDEGETEPPTPNLDLHLLDPLNKKLGEPPPPPAPHPHRGSLVNENVPPSPPPQTSTSSTSPSRVIGHLHSPQFTPVSAPVTGPQLLSSLGSLTSPGQVSPHMVPGHPAALELQHKPAGNGVSPSRESVEAAIADIKQAIRRTKNLPLKTHPQEKQDRGPVWIPRSGRRDFAYSKKHSVSPGTQAQMQGESPQSHHLQESSPSGCSNISNKSEERSIHDEDDGDTDQETDRLLGQQRSDDGFLDEKHNWSRLRSKPVIGMPLASNHKEGDSEGGGGLNSNDSTPSTPSHPGSTGVSPSSPQDLLSSNQFIAKKEKEYGKKKGRSKEVLIEGVLFRARYLGSTQLVSEGQPTKTTRMMQAEEAVSRIKAPEGEVQPSTEVDLFISTEKIMVLNTDLKEIMMDHALRTISYIADIGDLVVLMARRRVLPSDDQTENPSHRIPKMICHVFESDEAQFIAQSIGQAFQVAYLEFLKANGIEDHSFVKEMDYQEVLNSQEIFGDELQMFAKKELQKEVVVPKMKGDILGVVVVESGWGSMVPTVVIANLSPSGAAAKCGQLNIGDQIIAINGISLVGLPLSNCQNYIKNTKYNTAVKLTVVPCPPVVEVKIRRPDTKYQLGFSVQNGVICSLLRGGIAERGGVRVGHRIIDINSQSVVAVPHEKIVNLLATSVGEIRMKTMPTSIFRLLTGQETPQYI